MKEQSQFSVVLILAVVVCIGLPGLLFAGGQGESGDKPVELRMVYMSSPESKEGQKIYPLLEEWNAANPDVDLTVEYSQGEDMKTKIRVETAAGNVPDVFQYWMTISNSSHLHDGDVVLETMEYLKASKTLKPEQFTDTALKICTRNGVARGLPYLGYQLYFAINKDLYEKYGVPVPTTYEEFREGAKVFRSNGIIPFAMGSRSGNPSHFWFSELMAQLPGGLEEMGKLGSGGPFKTENALRVAEIIAEDMRLGVYPEDPVAAGLWDAPFALFTEEQAAAIYTATWMAGGFDEDFWQKKVQLIPTPRLPDAAVDPATFYSGAPQNGIFISKKSWQNEAKQEAIVRLVDFIFQPEFMNAELAASKVLTLKYDRDPSVVNTVSRDIQDFAEGKNANISHYTEIVDAGLAVEMKRALDELFVTSITPREFVDKVQKAFDEVQ